MAQSIGLHSEMTEQGHRLRGIITQPQGSTYVWGDLFFCVSFGMELFYVTLGM